MSCSAFKLVIHVLHTEKRAFRIHRKSKGADDPLNTSKELNDGGYAYRPPNVARQ